MTMDLIKNVTQERRGRATSVEIKLINNGTNEWHSTLPVSNKRLSTVVYIELKQIDQDGVYSCTFYLDSSAAYNVYKLRTVTNFHALI